MLHELYCKTSCLDLLFVVLYDKDVNYLKHNGYTAEYT